MRTLLVLAVFMSIKSMAFCDPGASLTAYINCTKQQSQLNEIQRSVRELEDRQAIQESEQRRKKPRQRPEYDDGLEDNDEGHDLNDF